MEDAKQILPAIAVIIFNDRNEVLLQKRRDVEKWNLISGHVEFGETVEQAVLREIREEINVNAQIKRFIGVYSSPDSQTYTYNNGTVHYITLYFEAILTGKLAENISNEETMQLRFFPIDNIPSDLDTIHPYWLNDALTNQQAAFVR